MSPKLSKSDIGSWVFGLQEEGRAIEAILAFGLLGTNAAPAVPQLAAMMNTRSQPGLVQRSIAALAAIGPPAHSALAQALSDTNFSERVEILIEIQIHTTNLSGSSPLRPVLQRLVLDPDSMVRDGARSALRQMAPELLTDNPAK
jgi:hypothetical protein